MRARRTTVAPTLASNDYAGAHQAAIAGMGVVRLFRDDCAEHFAAWTSGNRRADLPNVRKQDGA